eukprot:scaffold9078_cov129-Cylindrotheca_fusiformis.AAC.5
MSTAGSTAAQSGDLSKLIEGVKKQYDAKEKLQFYSLVIGDGTDNIHYGKWDNIDIDEPGGCGKASNQLSDWMFNLACELVPDRKGAKDFSYVDLGSGTAATALRLTEMNSFISNATCLNLCEEQNDRATKSVAEKGLGERIKVVTGTFEDCPFDDNSFDIAFSQDSFVHAFSKQKAFSEAFRVTKPGGAFMFCDLMCGDGTDVSDEELAIFFNTNNVNDWLTPEQNVQACTQAGWTGVTFVDMTKDFRLSFQSMLKKVEQMLERGNDGIGLDLLNIYKKTLATRIAQIDRGLFKWGVVHGKKPL